MKRDLFNNSNFSQFCLQIARNKGLGISKHLKVVIIESDMRARALINTLFYY